MSEMPVEEKLCSLIQRYGADIVSEPKRLEALLNDYCPDNKGEINTLLAAVNERIPAEMLSSSMPPQLLHARLTVRLQDNRKLTEEAARWAVQAWAKALLPEFESNNGLQSAGATLPQESAPKEQARLAPLVPIAGTTTDRVSAPRREEYAPHRRKQIAWIAVLVISVLLCGLLAAFITNSIHTHNANQLSQHPIEALKSQYGIELVLIPGGPFQMGDSDQKDNPRHSINLSSYYITKNLITVKQYLAFCTATGYKKPEAPVFNANWSKEDHPIVNVRWSDAKAYCDWLSKLTGLAVTLPTEVQWEKAARGTEGRKFPWGDSFASDKLWCSVGGVKTSTAQAGSFSEGASPYGVLDLAGNVWQWCSDWYAKNYWKSDHGPDPTGPASGDRRVLRGGSWNNYSTGDFRCSNRISFSRDFRDFNIGFRVVAAETH